MPFVLDLWIIHGITRGCLEIPKCGCALLLCCSQSLKIHSVILLFVCLFFLLINKVSNCRVQLLTELIFQCPIICRRERKITYMCLTQIQRIDKFYTMSNEITCRHLSHGTPNNFWYHWICYHLSFNPFITTTTSTTTTKSCVAFGKANKQTDHSVRRRLMP